MPAPNALFHPEPAPRAGRLHLCLLDHENRICGSNYAAATDHPISIPKMIRTVYDVTPHEDMPDSVYSRMEGRLNTSAGSAGYYLCRTKTGEVFWIAVSIYKTTGGRVICHMPVTSPLLKKFGAFYAHLKQAEVDDIDEHESVQRLLTLMLNEGVADYRSLATTIMIDEIGKRDAGHNRPQYKDLRALQSVLAAMRSIDDCGKQIDAMSDKSRLIPYQLKLQAARLEGGRGPLSVVADNHQELTDKLLSITRALQRASATELDAVIDAIAYVAQSNHAAELLDTGTLSTCGTAQAETLARDALSEVIEDCRCEMVVLLGDINTAIETLIAICRRMRRAVSAIEMTSMMCKVERARLTRDADGLKGIEEQLHQVQTNLADCMAHIDDNALCALALADQIKRASSA